jgi:hypothetical protein
MPRLQKLPGSAIGSISLFRKKKHLVVLEVHEHLFFLHTIVHEQYFDIVDVSVVCPPHTIC